MADAEDDLVTMPVSKRTIPAAGAPKLETSAANSVFALGGGVAIDAADAEPPAPMKRRQRAVAVPKERALAAIESCGDLSMPEFASALKVTHPQASKMLGKLRKDGLIEATKVKGSLTRFRLKTAHGSTKTTPFKGWLQKKGEKSAEGRTSTKRSPVVKIESAPLAPPAADDNFVCGLLHNGQLMIDADGQQMRLARPRVRALVAYLELIAAALQDRSAA